MRFFLYRGRHGQRELVLATKEGWDYLERCLERDNGISLQEAAEEGLEVSGSFQEAYLNVDDGGNIEEISLTELKGG